MLIYATHTFGHVVIFQKCIGPDMFSWIRNCVAEGCALPSAFLVLLMDWCEIPTDSVMFHEKPHCLHQAVTLRSPHYLLRAITFVNVLAMEI